MAGNNIFICQCDAFIHKNMPGAAEMITYTSHMELAAEEGVFEKKKKSENVVSIKEMDLLLQDWTVCSMWLIYYRGQWQCLECEIFSSGPSNINKKRF